MKQAGVMLIIKDGLILGISRRHDKTIFGLLGGKYDTEAGDTNTMDTAIRETKEEAGLKVDLCVQVYQRVEPSETSDGEDFYSTTYYATDWYGEPTSCEEGEVKWLTVEQLISTNAAFGDYNTHMLNVFREMFPQVYLRGE